MTTKATIELEGDFIQVEKLLDKMNEFMKDQINENKPVDTWKVLIEGGT